MSTGKTRDIVTDARRGEDCPAGFYQAGEGASTCAACPAGSYAADAGATSCDPCPAGTYQDTTGATACVACGAGVYRARRRTSRRSTRASRPRRTAPARRATRATTARSPGAPSPTPARASDSLDCDAATANVYELKIEERGGTISSTDDFDLAVYGWGNTSLSVCTKFKKGKIRASFPATYGVRKIELRLAAHVTDDEALTLTLELDGESEFRWDAALGCRARRRRRRRPLRPTYSPSYAPTREPTYAPTTSETYGCSYVWTTNEELAYDGANTITISDMVDLAALSTTCEDDTDTAITVSWAYTDAIYPNADDKLTQYTDAAGTDDVDYASSSVTCMIGLRFTGAPLDITPSMGSGTSGFSGVVFSWLDTSYEEAQFNVYRRSQGTPASANSHVADDADLASVTGSVDYTVPWIGDFKVAVVPNSNPNGAAEGVVSIAHMLTSSEPDPLYDPMVWGRTDADGVLSVVVRVVDYEWSDTTQYFNATPSLVEDGVSHVFSPAWQVAKATHIYGGSARFTDETTVLIQGYGFAVSATACGYVREGVLDNGAVVLTGLLPLQSYDVTMYGATRTNNPDSTERAAAIENCEDLAASGYDNEQTDPGDFVPCRVPIPYFDGQNARLPCSSWSSSTEARWTRVDEFFSGNGLGAYDSPYNNAARTTSGPRTNELLLLAAPEATESDDNAYLRRPHVRELDGHLLQRVRDAFELSFALREATRAPARVALGLRGAYGGSCGSLAFSYDAPTYDATTPGADHAIDVSVQDRVSGFTTTEACGSDGALDYGFQYAVAPNALNPFSPYTLQFNVEFSRATTDPTLIFSIIRDPPGGGSHVALEEGSTITTSMSIDGMHASAADMSASQKLSMGSEVDTGTAAAPLGIGELLQKMADIRKTMTRLAAALDAAGGDEALATEDLDAIQAAIDSWETVLAAYWATTANNEVVTLQSHVSTILATLESTFASFQDDMDDPSELGTS
ncbi:hypothetical protein SO694_00147039 [Aureococcus anophagefferens]|uniref:Tyrosine-protein kinase ephrin type A/B receptor-like domain-containing protein n=1 Tax=Aureococcus anophagefferens TaxID=44056 RepID=A0ABR1FNH6_AURAN